MIEVIRIIDGIRYRCRDIGCDNPVRAAWNRYIVKHGLFTTFWRELEYTLALTPQSEALPSWIPLGVLPQVSKQDWRQYGGEQIGMSEEDEE